MAEFQNLVWSSLCLAGLYVYRHLLFLIMSWYEKEKMMAIADPHGLSGDSYPDGTPMTNFERWEKLNEHSGQH